MISRRFFIAGAAAVAAPAIIRPGLLMPVKRMLPLDDGVALYSMAHPLSFDMIAPGLSEQSLVQLLVEVQSLRGYRGLKAHPRYIVSPYAS
jgi:hypothetical protein